MLPRMHDIVCIWLIMVHKRFSPFNECSSGILLSNTFLSFLIILISPQPLLPPSAICIILHHHYRSSSSDVAGSTCLAVCHGLPVLLLRHFYIFLQLGFLTTKCLHRLHPPAGFLHNQDSYSNDSWAIFACRPKTGQRPDNKLVLHPCF